MTLQEIIENFAGLCEVIVDDDEGWIPAWITAHALGQSESEECIEVTTLFGADVYRVPAPRWPAALRKATRTHAEYLADRKASINW